MDEGLLREVEEEIESIKAEGEPTRTVGGRSVNASQLLGIPDEHLPAGLSKSGYEVLLLEFWDWAAANQEKLMVADRGDDGEPVYRMVHKADFSEEDFYVRRIAFAESLLQKSLCAVEEHKFAAAVSEDLRSL